jgi:undecaprenyl-diphosphatase
MCGPIFNATLLGVVQGLTEFLPVSSDGHLALAELVFDVKEANLALNVMLHAGTWIATVLVLWKRVRPAVVDGVRAIASPERFRTTSGGRDALVVILASIPTAVIGFTLRHAVERWTHSPFVVGLGFLGTALAVLSTRFVRAGEREVPSIVGAVLIGVAQGLAVLPGLSRSGSTIALALWLGVRPDRAFELSMLMSLPAVLGAILLEARHLGGDTAVASAAIGAAIALFVGIVALLLLRRIVSRGHFALFALWVLPMAFVSFFYATRQ